MNVFCFNNTEKIHNYFISMYIRADQIALQSSISNVIEQVFESGLLVKWSSDIAQSNQRLIGNDFNNLDLQLESVYGTLFVYIAGTFSGLVFFLIEIYIHRKARVTDSRRIWLQMEYLIDGHRHRFFFVYAPDDLKRRQSQICMTFDWASILFDYLISPFRILLWRNHNNGNRLGH